MASEIKNFIMLVYDNIKLKNIIIILIIFCKILSSQEPIFIGYGSYASKPLAWKEPDAVAVANHYIYVTPDKANKPKPTNDWWTDLLWSRYFGELWAHPLVFEGSSNGVSIYFPKKWSGDANGASMDKGYPILIGGKNFKAADARAADWSDWVIKIKIADTNTSAYMDFTIGHGLPYGWAEIKGFIPEIKSVFDANYFLKNNTTRKSFQNFFPITNDHFIIEWNQSGTVKLFAIFAPSNTIFTKKSNTYDTVEVHFANTNQTFLIIAGIQSESDIELFYDHAYVIPRSSKVEWEYDREAGKVKTKWILSGENLKNGSEKNFIQGWIPHHYRTTENNLNFVGSEYQTSRGKLKLTIGTQWNINWSFNGIIPMMPPPKVLGITNDLDIERLRNYIRNYSQLVEGYGPDLYWGGKDLFHYSIYMAMAYYMNMTNEFNILKSKLRTALEDWLTYRPGETAHYYAAYPIPAENGNAGWGGLVPFGAGWAIYFTDHHLCLGYHYYAAAILSMFDKDFLEKYKDMLIYTVKETINWDRDDSFFPFMRTFDPWEGHSWAGGNSSPGGNNQESVSEAIHCYASSFLLGEIMGNKEISDVSAFAYAVENTAAHEYWFNVFKDNFPNFYRHCISTVCFGASIGFWTYFSGDPVWMHAIQWIPFCPTLDWLSRYTNYHRNEYWEMMDESPTSFLDWGGDLDNIVLGFISTFDPDYAISEFERLWNLGNQGPNQQDYTGGLTYYFIQSHRTYGDIRWDYYCNIPTSTIRQDRRNGNIRYIIYNPRDYEQIASIYSNGIKLYDCIVPANTTVILSNLSCNCPPAEFKIITTSPSNNSTNVSQSLKEIVILFSNPINSYTLTNNIFLKGSGVSGISNISENGSYYGRFLIKGELKFNTIYTLTIISNVKNFDNTKFLDKKYTILFKVKKRPTLEVISTIPVNEANKISVTNKIIKIYFNLPMALSKLTNIKIDGPGVTKLNPILGDGTNLVTLQIVGNLVKDSRYIITIPAGTLSKDNDILLNDYKFIFYTEPESCPPNVYRENFVGWGWNNNKVLITEHCTNNPLDGYYCMKLEGRYNPHTVEFYNGTWVWGSDRRPINLSEYDKIEFWIRGNYKNNVWTGVGVAPPDDSGYVRINTISITPQWKYYTINLPQNRTNINTLFVINVEPLDIIYLDNIRYIKNGTPAPVTNFWATPINYYKILLNWSDVSNETGYKIYLNNFKTKPTNTYVRLSSNITSFHVTNLLPGNVYYFWIEATNSIGSSSPKMCYAKTFSFRPIVISHIPTTNEINVTTNIKKIIINFSSNMNANSVLSATKFYKFGTTNIINFSGVSGNNSTITLFFNLNLEKNTKYLVTISTQAKSLGSNIPMNENYSFIFTTGPIIKRPIYVDMSNGDDYKNDGSISHPYRTLKKALLSLTSTNLNLIFITGTNKEEYYTAHIWQGFPNSEALTITRWTNKPYPFIKGYGKHIIESEGFTGISNIKIKGLFISNANYGFRFIDTAGGMKNIEIISNVIFNSGVGLQIDYASNVIIKSNLVYNCGWEAIKLNYCTNYIVQNNITYGNKNGYAFSIVYGKPWDDISYNIIYNHGGGGMHVNSLFDTKIRNNTIIGCKEKILDLWPGTYIKNINNIFAWNNGGITGSGDAAKYCLFYQNNGNINITISTGCITNKDPRFISQQPGNPYFMLIGYSSPCRDAGHPAYKNLPFVKGTNIDIGARENPGTNLGPATPQNLRAIPVSHSQIDLFWHDPGTTTEGYNIYISTTNNKPAFPTFVSYTTNFSCINLLPLTTYYFWIESFNQYDRSECISTNATTLRENIIFVDIMHKTPPWNGMSWQSAYTSINQALNDLAYNSNYTILVAPGIYKEKMDIKNQHSGKSGYTNIIKSIRPFYDYEIYASTAVKPINYIIDKNTNTRWESSWYDPQWIYFDFKEKKLFNKLIIEWESAYAKNYDIQVSSDFYNWTTVLRVTNIDGKPNHWRQTNIFSPVSARYLRLYFNERITTFGYSIWEIEIDNLFQRTNATIIDGINKPNCITISNCSFFKIQGLHFINANSTGIVMNNVTNCKIEYCISALNGGNGIEIQNGAGNLIKNCTIWSNNGSGIILPTGLNKTNLVKNTIVQGNLNYGILAGNNNKCEYNNVWNNLNGNYSGGIIVATNSISSNSIFVSFGRYNTNFLMIHTLSPCIDKGDPLDEVPYYGGTRIDIGRWEVPGGICPNVAITGLSEKEFCSPGEILEIFGYGFGNYKGNGYVKIGEKVVQNYLSWTNNRIKIIIPMNATDGKVVVYNNCQQSAISSDEISFSKVNITGFEPFSECAGGFINIYGTGFGSIKGNGKVYIGTNLCEVVDWKENKITVVVPKDSNGYITVINNCKAGATTGSNQLFKIKPVDVYASSEVNGNWSYYAIDTNNQTRWESTASDPQWIVFDFGREYNIRKTVIEWETAYTKTYKFEISTDKSNWFTIYTGTNQTGLPNHWKQTNNFSGIKTRYLRFYGIDRATGWGHSIWEFDAFIEYEHSIISNFRAPEFLKSVDSFYPTSGCRGDIITILGDGFGDKQGGGYVLFGNMYSTILSWSNQKIETVVPTGGEGYITVVNNCGEVKSTISNTEKFYNPVNAVASSEVGANIALRSIDNNPNTRWESASSDPQWILFDFGDIKVINKIVIEWETAYSATNAIQVSIDNVNWKTVASNNNPTGKPNHWRQTNIFVPVLARYLRIFSYKRATGWGNSIYECWLSLTSFTNFKLLSENVIISHFTPKSGSPGTVVNIKGSGFQNFKGNGVVTFNGIEVLFYSNWSDTNIIVKVPEGATTGYISVTNDCGAFAISISNFMVSNFYSPIIMIKKEITNITLQNISKPLIPGTTIHYKISVSNSGNYSGNNIIIYDKIIYDKIDNNTLYISNSASYPLNWKIEFSTNISPLQSWDSTDYTTNQLHINKIKWIRWKNTLLLPNESVKLFYRVYIR